MLATIFLAGMNIYMAAVFQTKLHKKLIQKSIEYRYLKIKIKVFCVL